MVKIVSRPPPLVPPIEPVERWEPPRRASVFWGGCLQGLGAFLAAALGSAVVLFSAWLLAQPVS